MKITIFLRTGTKFLFSYLLILGSITGVGYAQDIITKGSIGGRVTDSAGAVLPNASVTITGQAGSRTATTNQQGEFEVQNLIPGSYTVKAELDGFKKISVPDVEVYVGKTSTLKLA